jgi:hypothetical protein
MVTSSPPGSIEDASKSKTKGKSKAKAAGRELISDVIWMLVVATYTSCEGLSSSR